MRKKLTQSQFIQKVVSIHGDFYDLSNVVYDGIRKKITVHSRAYGEEIIPAGWLLTRKPYSKKKPESHTKSYKTWMGIIHRCRDKRASMVAYNGCSVCEGWMEYENFKKWFLENYIDGYELDKDIIKRGNRVYCPEYCSFVPKEINLLIKNRRRGSGAPGTVVRREGGKYIARMYAGRSIWLGSFETELDAFMAYKKAKESYVRDLAKTYFNKNKIERRVYDALMNYKVEITD